MKQPLFSILLPTHNRADVVGYALQSALSQTFRDFEVLVVGDGCTDNTESVIQKFIHQDERVTWYPFPKAAGFGYANRNAVLQKARGRYVAYLGHDDLWLPNHLEVMAEFFKKNSSHLIAYTRPLWMSDDGVVLPSFFNTDAPVIHDEFWFDHNEVPAICVVVKMTALKEAGFWIPGSKNAGDWDLWRRIIWLDPEKKLGSIPTPTTLNFKSNWRSDDEFLNIQLQIQRRMLLSSKLRKFFTIRRSKIGSTLQKDAWEQIRRDGWLEELVAHLPQVEDELLYKITLELHKTLVDVGKVKVIKRRIKQTEAYKSYLTLRRSLGYG